MSRQKKSEKNQHSTQQYTQLKQITMPQDFNYCGDDEEPVKANTDTSIDYIQRTNTTFGEEMFLMRQNSSSPG